MADQHIQIIMIQPTSLCNLNCKYCYVPNRKDRFVMAENTLEILAKKTLQSRLIDERIEFLWHAGEPLLAGKKFFNKAMSFFDDFNTRGLKITQSIQTNATMIDDEWCEFFKKHNFEVGVSIDGPSFLHDLYRRDWNNKGSHKRSLNGYKLLRKHNVSRGVICVLTAELLKHPDDVFNFFLDEDFHSIAFNVEEIENANKSTSFSDNFLKTQQEYIYFMSRISDLQRASGFKIEIREITQTYRVLAAKRRNPDYRRTPPEVLPFGMITIHKNGDVTPFSPEFAGVISEEFNNFVIGNILEDEVEDLFCKPTYLKIKKAVDNILGECASNCKYFDLCGGSFLSNKYSEYGDFLHRETISCKLHSQTLTDVLIEKARTVPLIK